MDLLWPACSQLSAAYVVLCVLFQVVLSVSSARASHVRETSRVGARGGIRALQLGIRARSQCPANPYGTVHAKLMILNDLNRCLRIICRIS